MTGRICTDRRAKACADKGGTCRATTETIENRQDDAKFPFLDNSLP